MIHAYSEIYLSNAKDNLSVFFDYLVNTCGYSADWSAALFVATGYAEQFERGNPAVLAGMSGIELAQAVLKKAYPGKSCAIAVQSEGCSPEYWAGWALAEYQWYSGRAFKDIFERIPMSVIVDMYSIYHEMDISQFNNAIDSFYESLKYDTKLKRIRESRGLSQRELAEESGVNIRSIRTYEQRSNDIDKAQARTLYKLSRVLGCSIEDLLEEPMA